jgi:hypothetical protein
MAKSCALSYVLAGTLDDRIVWESSSAGDVVVRKDCTLLHNRLASTQRFKNLTSCPSQLNLKDNLRGVPGLYHDWLDRGFVEHFKRRLRCPFFHGTAGCSNGLLGDSRDVIAGSSMKLVHTFDFGAIYRQRHLVALV